MGPMFAVHTLMRTDRLWASGCLSTWSRRGRRGQERPPGDTRKPWWTGSLVGGDPCIQHALRVLCCSKWDLQRASYTPVACENKLSCLFLIPRCQSRGSVLHPHAWIHLNICIAHRVPKDLLVLSLCMCNVRHLSELGWLPGILVARRSKGERSGSYQNSFPNAVSGFK